MADVRANSRNIEPRFYIGSGLDQRRSDFLSKHEEGGCWGPGIRHCCQFLTNRSGHVLRLELDAQIVIVLTDQRFDVIFSKDDDGHH